MQAIKYKIVGNAGRHISAGAVLVEFGQLKIEFEGLPEGTASAVVSINSVTNTFPIKDGFTNVSRMHLKVGVMQVRVHITDNSGKLVQVILCESVYISSTHNQVQEPLLAYPNLGDILDRLAATEQALAEAKAAYESKVSELEKQLAEINANYAEAISRLDNIQKSWDIYGIYENNENNEDKE